MQTPPNFEYWCYSTLSLLGLFDNFRVSFPTADNGFVHDSENVWEWIEGTSADRLLTFNISRPHHDQFEDESEIRDSDPIRFRFEVHDSKLHPDDIGTRLAAALGIDVHAGEVVYLNGNDFEFRVARTYQPP